MRILVTGAGGFVGRYLLQELAGAGHDIVATRRRRSGEEQDRSSRVEWCGVELLDPSDANTLVARAKPDAVLHLGAVTFVPEVERDRSHAWSVNAGGTLNLLEALRRAAPAARFVLISSAHVYASAGGCLSEDHLVDPPSFYGLTKAAAEQVCNYFRRENTAVWIARAFNHIGPGQASNFVAPSFALQIAKAEAGLGPASMDVGNLDVERDFTDVRDVVRAYRLLAEGVAPQGIYNVASGAAVSIRWMLDTLRDLARVAIEVRVDPKRMRGGEQPSVTGDATRLREATGWCPTIALETSLAEILCEARELVARDSA